MSLIVISFIDIEHMIIPDVITYPGIIIGLFYSILNTDFRTAQILIENINLDFLYLIYVADEISVVSSILGILLGGGSLLLIGFVYKIVRKTDGLGLGDVKLLAMIGAFLGWRSIIFVALVSSLVGTIIGLSIILYNKNGLKYAIPFGPFLSFAAALYCFSSDLSLDYFLD
jgi:leader peptidase (prepilin peptidase)/N-methyltransferase